MQENFPPSQKSIPLTWILPARLRSLLDKHPVGKNLYITEIGFYNEQVFFEKDVFKNNPDYVLIYCAGGTGWYKTDSKKHDLRANHFVLFPRKTSFQAGAGSARQCSFYFIKFNGAVSKDMYEYLHHDDKAEIPTPPLVGRTAQFRDIMHHLDLMENIENLLYANFRFYSFLGSFRLTVFNYMKKGTDNIIERCIIIMKEHINQNLTLEEIANKACLSASYLSAIFKQKTHYSPIRLYASLKIQRASQLLKATKTPVKQIAAEMGYTDQYSFSRSFKQIMGISPKKFREQK
ncbi:AraC family transcriptional regulator [Parafilimonas sp.]|uniref:AraC family transcriptional regulator n=1 Tax=Parafilimonas sp. TaxID=1969739 RepID=UPI0039E56AF7